MARLVRIKVGGYIYHVLNRANARACIFNNDKDYQSFEAILEDAVIKFDMRLLSYSLMPNHWHLVLYPKNDGDLVKFMSWLTITHTKRWHIEKILLAKVIFIREDISHLFAKMIIILSH